MDLPLPSVAHQHDHYKSSAFLERISSATPPPPYDDAINQEPWVSRFGQTMMEMRRVLHDTQDTIHDMKGAFGHLDETDHLFAESLEKSIQTHHMNESDKEEGDDDLARITQSLQHLIEQAQTSLKTRMTIRDPTCMAFHRSVSCPHLTAVYCDSAGEDDGIDNEEQKWTCRHHRHRTPEDTEEDRRRRKLGRASTMFPQSSSLRAQEERYRDSQWRLTMAMQELVDTVDTYHGEDMDLAATLAEPQQQSQPRSRLPVRPRPGTAPTGAAAGSTPRRRGKRQKNIHHHHHHHHYHNPQQIINVHPSFASPTMIGHMLTHAWTSIRTSLSDARKQKQNHPCAAVETAAPIAPSSCRSVERALSKHHEQLSPPQKQEQPKRLSLSRPNIARMMLFVTMLLFSFMHPSTKDDQKSRRTVALERCVGHFLFTSADLLPVSTWIQRSSLVVYTLAFM